MKSVRIKRIVFILYISFLLCSCSHYYYVSNVQNVPLFREKNEYRFSGGYGFGDESQCVEIQAAYAVGNKVGISGNFMTAWGGDVPEKDYGKGTYIDGGIGYYKPVAERASFEIYGGIGGSSQHHEYTGYHYSQGTITKEYFGSSDLSFFKLYVQPSFGMMFSFFDVVVSTRLNSVSYISVDNYVLGNFSLTEELNAVQNKGHLFIEPAFTLRFGWERVKLQLQGSYARYLNSPMLYFGEEMHLSVGLCYTFTKRFNK